MRNPIYFGSSPWVFCLTSQPHHFIIVYRELWGTVEFYTHYNFSNFLEQYSLLLSKCKHLIFKPFSSFTRALNFLKVWKMLVLRFRIYIQFCENNHQWIRQSKNTYLMTYQVIRKYLSGLTQEILYFTAMIKRKKAFFTYHRCNLHKILVIPTSTPEEASYLIIFIACTHSYVPNDDAKS